MHIPDVNIKRRRCPVVSVAKFQGRTIPAEGELLETYVLWWSLSWHISVLFRRISKRSRLFAVGGSRVVVVGVFVSDLGRAYKLVSAGKHIVGEVGVKWTP